MQGIRVNLRHAVTSGYHAAASREHQSMYNLPRSHCNARGGKSKVCRVHEHTQCLSGSVAVARWTSDTKESKTAFFIQKNLRQK